MQNINWGVVCLFIIAFFLVGKFLILDKLPKRPKLHKWISGKFPKRTKLKEWKLYQKSAEPISHIASYEEPVADKSAAERIEDSNRIDLYETIFKPASAEEINREAQNDHRKELYFSLLKAYNEKDTNKIESLEDSLYGLLKNREDSLSSTKTKKKIRNEKLSEIVAAINPSLLKSDNEDL